MILKTFTQSFLGYLLAYNSNILTKKVIYFLKIILSSHIFGRFSLMDLFWMDPFSHFTIRIRIRPNDMDPTGSGTTTLLSSLANSGKIQNH